MTHPLRRRGRQVRRAALPLLLALPACATVPVSDGPDWRPLFDGKSLVGLHKVAFGGEGAVAVAGGRIVLEQGSPLTGFTCEGALPAAEYELELQAARLLGDDFFCGLTFPVGDAHLTLVLGGWGGTVCGLSCLDGADAARNGTRRLLHFERGRPYRIRLGVTADHVRAAVDGQEIVDCDLRGRALSLRAEMEPCRPLGIASYATRAAIWDLRWRPLRSAP